MKKYLDKLSAILLSMLLLLGAIPVQAAYVGGNYLSSAGACVMDYETGDILYSHNGDVPRVPASMTKIMTVYLVFEALANEEITLDTPVPISENVYNKSRNSVYQSVLPLYYDTTYTVDEMLDVVVVYSASGAAVALAELVGGGSEQAFVDRMNQKAAEMGLDAWYYDSCGIADNELSPIAMATLTRNIIHDYPEILERTKKTSVTFHGNTYRTTNHLLDTYYYEGADGLKTGTTPAAGYCFCGTAVRDGRRMIAVTMSSSSTGQRFIDTARLLDYGFAAAQERYNTIYFTAMRTFINGAEVPTFEHRGDRHAVIVAEDLKDYGFDTYYDDAAKTLYVTRNPDKEITPIPMDYYRAQPAGSPAYTVNPDAGIQIVLTDGAAVYTPQDVYSVGGYLCLSIDELQNLYSFRWSSEDNAAYITLDAADAQPQVLPPEDTAAGAAEESGCVLGDTQLTSQSAFILDYDTGEELFAYQADEQKPVASIAKMMSVYVILDAIKAGEIGLDTVVPISENVYDLSREEEYKMMVNLEYDEVYTVDEMIDMIVIDSAAACVTAVAELLCGSEAAFVERMNLKAEELGIDSVFYNGTGVCLNPETEQENLMSAREVAILAQRMIQDYPEILERTSRASVEFHGNTYYNLNKLFTDYYYEGADGFKNGMTDAAGYCMCGTAERDGRRIITVTLPSDSDDARFTDTIAMFNYGFMQLGVSTPETVGRDAEEPFFADAADIKINIDGNYEMTFPDQQPVVVNGRAMVPVRPLMEILEKSVSWDEASQTICVYDDVTSVTLKVGSTQMTAAMTNPLDGSVRTVETVLDEAPVLVGGRTCLPVRAVAEAFGMAVIWEESTGTILIIAGVC